MKVNLALAIIFLILGIVIACCLNYSWITFYINYGRALYLFSVIWFWISIILHFLILLIISWSLKKPFNIVIDNIKSKN